MVGADDECIGMTLQELLQATIALLQQTGQGMIIHHIMQQRTELTYRNTAILQ